MKKVFAVFLILIILFATFAFGGYFVMLKQNIVVSDNYVIAGVLGMYSVYDLQVMDGSVIENAGADGETDILVVDVPGEEEKELFIVPNTEDTEVISEDINE